MSMAQMLEPMSRSVPPPRARYLPLLLQLRFLMPDRVRNGKVFTSATFRSAPPSAGIRKTVAVSSLEYRKNAMCCPSGDQAGCRSAAGLAVKRIGSPGPTSFTYMSWLSSSGPFHEKATWLPSGDKVGCTTYPGYEVRGRTVAFRPPGLPGGLLRSDTHVMAPANPISASTATRTRLRRRTGRVRLNATASSVGKGDTGQMNRYPCFGTVSIYLAPSSPKALRSADI